MSLLESGVHHENGVAERSIQTDSSFFGWPEVSDQQVWTLHFNMKSAYGMFWPIPFISKTQVQSSVYMIGVSVCSRSSLTRWEETPK